jgi:hypothetical protein
MFLELKLKVIYRTVVYVVISSSTNFPFKTTKLSKKMDIQY